MIIKTAGNWALGADSLQWILYRNDNRASGRWTGVSFVHSTRQVLERCMREKGVEAAEARELLSGLPDTFDAWKTSTPVP